MRKPASILAALVAALAPAVAWAHPGHGGGFAAGLLHPLSGVDHCAAMLLAGAWAAQLPQRGARALPLGFCAAMLAGFAAAPWIGATLAETLVTASVLALGAAVMLRLCPPLVVALIALGLFGFGHGLAHGLETPDGTTPWRFVIGFLATSAVLQGVGMAVARAFATGRARAPADAS
jgi:urease accessory protein